MAKHKIQQTLKEIAKKCFCDKNGKVVIGQAPNWQIIATIIAYLAHRLLINNAINEIFYTLFIIFFTFWAYEELFNGVNYFRKFLGLATLVLILFLLLSKF